MPTDLVFISAAVASFSVIWRKLLNDLPALKRGIMERVPSPANRALTCGFCFTYWASLAATLLFDPLAPWHPPLRSAALAHTEPLVHVALSWMLIGFVAITFRFLFVVIQELVDYQMYTMNKQFHAPEYERDHLH